MKRIWSLMLAVMMVFTMLPATAITALAESIPEEAAVLAEPPAPEQLLGAPVADGGPTGEEDPTDDLIALDAPPVGSPTDVSGLIIVEVLSIWQKNEGGQLVEIPAGGNINPGLPIEIEMKLRVPVVGDDLPDDQVVHLGDFANLKLSNQFELVGDLAQDLRTSGGPGGKLVGNVVFRNNADEGAVYADIVFDGDQDIYELAGEDGAGQPFDVTAGFRVTLKYAGNPDVEEDGILVSILDKGYTFDPPEPKLIHTVEKEGAAYDLAIPGKEYILWTVTISADKGGIPQSLAGYQFLDALTGVGVGAFIPGSFQVNGEGATPVYDTTTKLLSYEFSEDTESPVEITFKTGVSDALLNKAGQSQTVTNTARLKPQDGPEFPSNEAKVTFTPPTWITKSGSTSENSDGVYNPKDRTITWTIVVNPNGQTLTNAVVTDIINFGPTSDLIFVRATQQKKVGETWTDVKLFKNHPTDHRYILDNVSELTRLVIVVKVKDPADGGIVDVSKPYSNTATLSWDGSRNYSAGASVGIGYSAFFKESTGANGASGQLNWKVTVNLRNQADLTDLVVYDLLVHGSQKLSASDLDLVWPSHLSNTVKAAILAGDQALNQKLAPNNVFGKTPDTLVINTYPILRDGVPVADLIQVTGLVQDANQHFTFSTQMTNPGHLLGKNSSERLYNHAKLFSGDRQLSVKSASATFPRRTLHKELLHRDEVPKADASILPNHKASNTAQGYDHTLNQAIFRLNVNGNGFNFQNLNLGVATLVDTLPDGWEFVPFDNGDRYLLYAANGSGSSLNAIGAPIQLAPDQLTVTPGTVEKDGTTRNTLTFRFANLTTPYVILVKAAPTGDTLKDYLLSGRPETEVENNATLTASGIETPGSAKVKVQASALTKEAVLQEKGEITWQVDYRPAGHSLGNRLEDTLRPGIDLRTDAHGSLLIDGNIWLWTLEQQVDGSWKEKDLVPLVLGENILYSNINRTLTVRLADPTQAYRLQYITDLTGDSQQVSNIVGLWQDDQQVIQKEAKYTAQHHTGWADLKYAGWVEITKKDGQSGEILPGVEFTLFAEDGKTPLRSGITNQAGKVRFLALQEGRYIIKETGAPEGYRESEAQFLVTITKKWDGTMATTVQTPWGDRQNMVTVLNYQELAEVGKLTLTKTVAGNNGDQTTPFEFIITFTPQEGQELAGEFLYTGQNGAVPGILENGGSVWLSHGQKILFEGLPYGTKFVVKEVRANLDGYTTRSTHPTGTIGEGQDEWNTVFTNTRNSRRPRDDDDDTPTTPGTPGTIIIIDGDVPLGALPKTGSQLSATLGRAGLMALLLGAGLTALPRNKRRDEDDGQ